MTDNTNELNYTDVMNQNLKIRAAMIAELAEESKVNGDARKLLLAYLSDTDNVGLKQKKLESDNSNATADRELVIATLKHVSVTNKNPFEGISDTSNIPKIQESLKDKYEIKEDEKQSFKGTTYQEFKEEMAVKNPALREQIESQS